MRHQITPSRETVSPPGDEPGWQLVAIAAAIVLIALAGWSL